VRRNIDAWWPDIEAGAEAIITTASGCGVMVKDYGHLLQDDVAYAAKAQRVSELAKDIVQVLQQEDLSALQPAAKSVGKVAFHPPCTLQHGQQLPLITESLLAKLGFQLTPFPDALPNLTLLSPPILAASCICKVAAENLCCTGSSSLMQGLTPAADGAAAS